MKNQFTNLQIYQLYFSIYNILRQIFQRVAFGAGFKGFESDKGAVYVLFSFDHGFLGAVARADLLYESGHVLVIGPAAIGQRQYIHVVGIDLSEVNGWEGDQAVQ